MKQNNSIVYGKHASLSCIERMPEHVLQCWLSKSVSDEFKQQTLLKLETLDLKPQWVDNKSLDKMTDSGVHQGIVLVIKPNQLSETELEPLLAQTTHPLLLLLDGVEDPHNLGACLRSANAAGATALIVPKNNASPLTSVVRKVACGAAELTPVIQVANISRTMKQLQQLGIWIYGTDGQAEQTLYQTTFTPATAIVMGAEGKGLRRLTRDYCDYLVRIPMQGEMESLNVSVATGVMLFEVARQRLL